MSDGCLYGYAYVTRVCLDCDKEYPANAYDPNLYCPVCRIKWYRKEENDL